MSFIIRSGGGNAKEASVDDSKRLCVRSITENERDHAAELGQHYNICTGSITLTGDATESAVLYFKNNEDYDFYVHEFLYNVGASTSGVGSATVDIYTGITGGTIISTGPTNVDMNRNHLVGSSNSLTALAYKGAEARTQTGGTIFDSSFMAPGTFRILTLDRIVIPKGQSIGVTITTPGSNSSMPVIVTMSGFLATAAILGGVVE